MTCEILSVNLDSLYLSVHGTLSKNSDIWIPAYREEAQQRQLSRVQMHEHWPEIPGGPFYVSANGRKGSPYVLENSRFNIGINRRGGSRPVLTVQVASALLYEYELDAVEHAVQLLLARLMDDVTKLTVSRADVALDFQEKGWEYPSMSECKTRARDRFVNYQGNVKTGMTFGKHHGSLQVQIYSKSETLKADNKEWMKRIWSTNNPAYDEETGVQRVEVRFYRQALREMKNDEGSITSISDLAHSLSDLAHYAIAGPKPYFRVLDPLLVQSGLNSRNTERIDDAGWWEIVKRGFARLAGESSRKRINEEAKHIYREGLRRVASGLASIGAIARSQDWNRCTDPALFAYEAMKEFFSEDRVLWAEMVEKKSEDLQLVLEPLRRRPPKNPQPVSDAATASHEAFKNRSKPETRRRHASILHEILHFTTRDEIPDFMEFSRC